MDSERSKTILTAAYAENAGKMQLTLCVLGGQVAGLGEQLPNQMPMHIRQPAVNAVVPERQLRMIDAQ